MKTTSTPKASGVYVGATYGCLAFGMAGFLLGLWNAGMELNEKGYFFTLLAFGLFAAVSLQKVVRDKEEGIPASGLYQGLCYGAVALSVGLLSIGLYNASLLLSEKGYYLMCFVLALYSGVTVQKNVRDSALIDRKVEEL
jgi:uncharacterized membrane protein YiaA